ncbi:FadR/GntR family transcriptional regulator [Pseudonocardia acaciae]|uniref:FadR/GntR family transcriptional regulator n=1 Tax=Pseudonocardia acaciae TaxID=551276 RepID=UPI0006858A45|nr:FCD domain-containing protein [Pseudonocardia acaciae]
MDRGSLAPAPAAAERLPRLYESVVDRVLEVVESRGIQPGGALPTERELAETLRVSRNVLRQAFGVLEERGIVVSRRGAGRYLRDVSGSERGVSSSALEVASIADLLEARIILEAHVAVLACQRRTRDEAQRLIELAATLSSWEDNLEFHTAIAAASHNFALERMCRQQAELQGALHPRDRYDDHNELERMRTEHHEIALAIAARDEAQTRRLVERHLERTRSVITSADDTD